MKLEIKVFLLNCIILI